MLLLVHRCALLFLFILGVSSFCSSVDRSVGGCLGSVASARSYSFLFVVYGHLTSQGLSLSALATSLAPRLLHLRADYPGNLLR